MTDRKYVVLARYDGYNKSEVLRSASDFVQ